MEHVVYGYRTLGFGVLTNPDTDRVIGYIITVPEGGAPATGPGPVPPALPLPPAPP